MWVSASTDYAIRMMICLADAAGPVSSSKLARIIGVSTRYLLQIGARLRDAGMITVTYGSSGGYKLSLPPEEICLLDIIMLMERRAEQTAFRSDEATETEFQLLEQTYRDLGSQFSEQLRKTTISKLLLKKLILITTANMWCSIRAVILSN